MLRYLHHAAVDLVALSGRDINETLELRWEPNVGSETSGLTVPRATALHSVLVADAIAEANGLVVSIDFTIDSHPKAVGYKIQQRRIGNGVWVDSCSAFIKPEMAHAGDRAVIHTVKAASKATEDLSLSLRVSLDFGSEYRFRIAAVIGTRHQMVGPFSAPSNAVAVPSVGHAMDCCTQMTPRSDVSTPARSQVRSPVRFLHAEEGPPIELDSSTDFGEFASSSGGAGLSGLNALFVADSSAKKSTTRMTRHAVTLQASPFSSATTIGIGIHVAACRGAEQSRRPRRQGAMDRRTRLTRHWFPLMFRIHHCLLFAPKSIEFRGFAFFFFRFRLRLALQRN